MLKKQFIIVLLAVCCALVFALCAGAAVLGDVDGNGSREAADARLTLRAAVGLEDYAPGSPEFAAADSNGDGVIDASDARAILRTAVELEVLPEDPAAVTVGEDFADPKADWADYDALIAAIRNETDPEKREALMHEAEDMLMSGYCVLPLYYYNDSFLLSPEVEGVYANPYGYKFFRYASKKDGGKTLRVYLASEPDTLDPGLVTSADGASMVANSFAGLYTYNADDQLVPACAESCDVSADGLTYTVKLKQGLKWSDGTPLTVHDFIHAWKRASQEEVSDYSYLFSVFEGYEEKDINVGFADDYTLSFVLKAPCAYMLDLLAFPTFCPVKKEAVMAPADWVDNPDSWCSEAGFVSNGAFKCTGWEHDVCITFEKNPYYYDADAVKLDKIEFMLWTDGTAYDAFKAGTLDFSDDIPPEAFGELFITHNEALHIQGIIGTYYACFNAKSELFKDKTAAQAACIREAVSLLIDKERICIEMGGGESLQPAGTFIPAAMSNGNGGRFHEDTDHVYLDPYAKAREPEKTLTEARRLLAAAGYTFKADGTLSDETPLTISYLTNSGGNVRIAEMIKEDLAVLGITLKIEEMEWKEFLEARENGTCDMIRSGWIADYNDPVNMLEMWTTDSGNNTCGFGK